MTARKHTTSDRGIEAGPVENVCQVPGDEMGEIIEMKLGPGHTLLAKVSPRGCHLCFSHAPGKHGYIQIRLGGNQGTSTGINRLVYLARKGEIPDGMVVRHTCDEPSCINPDHLILGTHADNVADRVARDRSAKGIENGRAKLTPEDVDYIHKHPEETHASLARRFDVTPKVIWCVRYGLKWQHCRPAGEIPASGEWNRHIKLTAADIPVIRRLAAEGVSHRRIGLRFGVNKTTISRIIGGERWKCVAK
jgi:predicted DNA-binding protein (UPF0251 family)